MKNQGDCDSCYAFVSIAAIESAYAIRTGELIVQSEQELIDCTLYPATYNAGCLGGTVDETYSWLQTHYTMKESDYPYTSGSTDTESEC